MILLVAASIALWFDAKVVRPILTFLIFALFFGHCAFINGQIRRVAYTTTLEIWEVNSIHITSVYE